MFSLTSQFAKFLVSTYAVNCFTANSNEIYIHIYTSIKIGIFDKVNKSWIYNCHLVKKETFKLFTTGELKKRTLIYHAN